MVVDDRKRQKKLARKKAKKKNESRQPANLSIVDRIEQAASAPVLHCCTTNDLWDQGMSNVVFSRELRSGNVAFAVFLLDAYCLGVKDVAFNILSRSNYERDVYKKFFKSGRIIHLKPSAARKLIEGGVKFAGNCGLPPHRDYFKALRIFGDIKPESDEPFTYGKGGKPYFINGPHDSMSRCANILDTLKRHCGPDGYDAVFINGDASGFLDDE